MKKRKPLTPAQVLAAVLSMWEAGYLRALLQYPKLVQYINMMYYARAAAQRSDWPQRLAALVQAENQMQLPGNLRFFAGWQAANNNMTGLAGLGTLGNAWSSVASGVQAGAGVTSIFADGSKVSDIFNTAADVTEAASPLVDAVQGGGGSSTGNAAADRAIAEKAEALRLTAYDAWVKGNVLTKAQYDNLVNKIVRAVSASNGLTQLNNAQAELAAILESVATAHCQTSLQKPAPSLQNAYATDETAVSGIWMLADVYNSPAYLNNPTSANAYQLYTAMQWLKFAGLHSTGENSISRNRAMQLYRAVKNGSTSADIALQEMIAASNMGGTVEQVFYENESNLKGYNDALTKANAQIKACQDKAKRARYYLGQLGAPLPPIAQMDTNETATPPLPTSTQGAAPGAATPGATTPSTTSVAAAGFGAFLPVIVLAGLGWAFMGSNKKPKRKR